MKTILSVLAVVLCAICSPFAQAPAIQWQNTIGGDSDDKLCSLQQTTDGGYILGGFSFSDISGDKSENHQGESDYWVVKLNDSGAVQWQNTIGGTSFDVLFSLQQTTEGGYILGGYSSSDISIDKTENSLGGRDFWVVKLNGTGNIQWQNTIGGSGSDILRAIQLTSDGGYILGGNSDSNISGDKTENSLGDTDYWLLKLDATGIIQWQKTIGGNLQEYLHAVQQTADGGYILGGFSYSNISGDKTEDSNGNGDYWVVKLDSTGNIQWQNSIGGSEDDVFSFSSLQQTVDGGFILGGYSYSNISGDKTENSWGKSDYWVVKLDATGDIQWQNDIGGTENEVLFSLQQTADGGYITGGYSLSNASGDKTENNWGDSDYWVVKLDSIGQIQWQNTIGGGLSDQFRCLQQTADGGYILGGHSDSSISGDKTENSNGESDLWIIKLAPEFVPTKETSTALKAMAIYPNPTTDALFVNCETATTLCLQNSFGQILSTQTIQGQGKIDLSRYPNGIYFLVEMETGVGHKILKNK